MASNWLLKFKPQPSPVAKFTIVWKHVTAVLIATTDIEYRRLRHTHSANSTKKINPGLSLSILVPPWN